MRTMSILDCQKRLLIEHYKPEKMIAYNCCYHFKLRGDLNIAQLENALMHITSQHEVFTLRFDPTQNNRFEAAQLGNAKLNFELVELRSVKDQEGSLRVAALMDEFERYSFDLNDGSPLYRYRLIKAANEATYVFSMLWHHLIMDGVSVRCFIESLSKLYNGFLHNKILSESKIQDKFKFEDFISHERISLIKNKNTVSYWGGRLRGARAHVDLYPSRKSSNSDERCDGMISGARVRHSLSKIQSDNLMNSIENEKCTLFHFLTAAFAALIYRYAGTKDITVGYGVNLRDDSLRDHLGCYINNLPLRLTVDGGMNFHELINLVKKTRSLDKAHQNVFGSKIIEILRGVDGNKGQIWNLAISEITSAPANLAFEGVLSEIVPVNFISPRTDLLIMFDKGENISIEFEYNTKIFPNWFIEQLRDGYLNILHGAVNNPEMRVNEVKIMKPELYHRLMVQFNEHKDSLKIDNSAKLHGLFEVQVEKTPNKVAIITNERSITYRELNNVSNALAEQIRRAYVKENGGNETPHKIIGVYAECGIDVIVGMMAVLKADSGFMILDPSFPKARITSMLENVNVGLILYENKFAEVVGDVDDSVKHIPIITAAPLNKAVWQNRILSSSHESIAYVVHTSGTTGAPKGVMIGHKSIVNYILWMRKEYRFGCDDSILQKTALSFDASIWDFFLPLSQGCKLVFSDSSSHNDITKIIESVWKYKINILQFTPSVLDILLNHVIMNNLSHKLKSLKMVFCGGEHLETTIIDKFNAVLNARLINLYGPTEATIAATHWEAYKPEINSHSNVGKRLTSIGRPINNVCCYILDDDLNIVPLGVIGTLYVGGVGVARHIIQNGKYQEFLIRWGHNVCNSKEEGIKLYKTGDLASWGADGNLMYYGRCDTQIKRAGVRIESKEIDDVLSGISGVERSITTNVFWSGKRYLVSYLKIVEGYDKREPEVIKKHIKTILPEFMIPDFIIHVDDIPLTISGKVDEFSLNKNFQMSSITRYVSPRNTTEYHVLTCFKKILGQNAIGVLDDFFAHGGTSLMAMELAAVLKCKMSYGVSLAEILRLKTVEKIAGVIHTGTVKEHKISPLVRLTDRSEGVNIICIHPAGGTAFCYLTLAEHLGDGYSVYGIQSPKIDDPDFESISIRNLAECYVAECISAGIKKDIVLIGWSLGGVVAHEMAVNFETKGVRVGMLILLDTQPPIKKFQDGVVMISREEYVNKLIKFNGMYDGITDVEIDKLHDIYNSLTYFYRVHKPKICNCITVLIRSLESLGNHGWSGLSAGGVRVLTLQAGHWEFMTDPYVAELAVMIKDVLTL